jgi:E3 ubiquitin-protein ligase RNF1/2
VLAKFNKSHSQQALVNSITEGIKLQSQNRPQRRKNQDEVPNDSTARDISSNSQGSSHGGESTRQSSNPPSARSTPSPVPSHSSSTSKPTKRARSIMTTSERSEDSESNSEMDGQTENESNADTEDGTDGNDEIELVFKPHPTEMNSENVLMKALKDNTVRYIKTTANATVDHLSKYLAMRLSLDAQLAEPTFKALTFSIYIVPAPSQFAVLSGNQTLQQVNEKFWKVSENRMNDLIFLPTPRFHCRPINRWRCFTRASPKFRESARCVHSSIVS